MRYSRIWKASIVLMAVLSVPAMAQSLKVEVPCPDCTCEETLARLTALENAVMGLGMCPPPDPNVWVIKSACEPVAAVDTAESVKEGVQLDGRDASRSIGSDSSRDLDIYRLPARSQSWPSRHPVATSFLVGLGITAFNAVAHHNEWLWYEHDEGERGRRGRRGPAGDDGQDGNDGEDAPCWPPGHCK